MAGVDNRKETRVPLAAKVQIKTEGLEKFIDKFSGNISRGGIFIKTPTPLPIGKEIHFTVVMAGGTQLIDAKGTVNWVRAQADPKTGEPAGMGIQFSTLAPGSAEVIEQIVKAGEAKAEPVATAPPVAPLPAAAQDFSSEPISFEVDVPIDSAPTPAPSVAAQAPTPTPPPTPSPSPTLGPMLDASGLGDLFGGMEDELEHSDAPTAPPAAPATARSAPVPPSPTPIASAPVPAPVAAAPARNAIVPPPAPAAASRDTSGLDSLMGDIEDVLSDKPISAAVAPTAATMARAATQPLEARAPEAPTAPPPAPHAPTSQGIASASSTSHAAALPPSDMVLGIDLGTTNSCAAYLKPDGTGDVIPTDSGYRTIPSVVTITANEQIVGRAAYDRIATLPKNTVYGSKRLLGRKFISRAVQDARKYFDYEIVGDENGNAAVRIDGEIFPLVMVTARILEEIRHWARIHFKTDVTHALITVPAYYNDNQRNAVIEAGRLAGFEVKRIVNEPVAAALAYGYDKALQQRLLVYDLGGGTFDVSVMELNQNVFDVIAAGGDPYLGGVDFDNHLVDHLVAEFKRLSGVDVSQDKVAILRLRSAAERAKQDLSEQAEVRLQLPYLARTADGGVASMDLVLKRTDLERIVKPLIDRTIAICTEVLHAAGLERNAIDAVLLVGGQTRMPLIQSMLTEYFGKPPRKGVHPDEAVALGAALLAGSLERVDSVVLLDVVSMSIGVGMPGGAYQPVLMRNSKLPASASTFVTTSRDNETSISIDIFQGDSVELSRNDYLGTIELEGFPAAPAGHFQFEISFRMDGQGFLVVIATERSSGITQQMVLRTRESPEALQAAVTAG